MKIRIPLLVFEILILIALIVAVTAPARAGHDCDGGPATVPDMARFVVVGDSLSAGFQNGSLHQDQQPNGFASLIAHQACTGLVLPLIVPPGIPNRLIIKSFNPLVIEPEVGMSPGRFNFLVQATNLAVPGHRVQDSLTTRPDFSFDDLTDLVLGLPGVFSEISRSQVEWAEDSSPFIAGPPTTILVWLGPNDTLVAATEADASFLTPSHAFKDAYEEMMDRLAATGADIVVANVPDATVIPFLTPAEDLAAAFGIPTGLLRPTLGIGPGDFVTPDAFPVIEDILNMEASPPLAADVVLDAGEVARLRAATKAFNKFIAKQAEEHGAALFDVHGFLNRIDAEGTVVDGATLTTDFLGGLFSLDGVHPTNTGYALLANEFIEVMNAHFGAAIPPLSDDELAAILADDPLVFAAPAPVTTAVESMPTATADAIRAVLLGR